MRSAGRAAANAIASQAGPAARLAVGAYNAYVAYRGRRAREMRRNMGKYYTSARYVGRFKKLKKRMKKIDLFLKYGFKNVTEVSGTVSDPDCVYVGHSTMCGHRLLTLFLQATLRKLFRIGVKWNCTDVSQLIRGYQNNSDGFRLILVNKNVQTGVETEVVYDTVAIDSIARITGDTAGGVAPAWSALYNAWVDYIGRATFTSEGAIIQPTRLCLYQRDGNITNFYHFLGDVYWPNEYINVYLKSEMKIQNRTLSATASADSDDVTNNPLQGKLYQFGQGAPRAKVDGANFVEGVLDSTGVITKRAAEFNNIPNSFAYREPPEASLFRNVVKTSKVLLQPGNIKKDVLVFKLKRQVYTFWERLDWRTNAGTLSNSVTMKMMGKCTLIALEDMINVNVSQNISIAYEVNREEAMYLSTSSITPAQGAFYQGTQSNNPV